jgi:hypothetical protein
VRVIVGCEVIAGTVIPRPVEQCEGPISPSSWTVVLGFGDTGDSEPLSSDPGLVESGRTRVGCSHVEREGIFLDALETSHGSLNVIEGFGDAILSVCFAEIGSSYGFFVELFEVTFSIGSGSVDHVDVLESARDGSVVIISADVDV